MIAFIIFFLCGSIFLAIGINAFYSKKQQNFWSSGKMPKVNDIKKWNHALGKLFFAYGISLIFTGISFLLPIKSNLNNAIVLTLAIGGMPIIILIYIKIIEPKYKVK